MASYLRIPGCAGLGVLVLRQDRGVGEEVVQLYNDGRVARVEAMADVLIAHLNAEELAKNEAATSAGPDLSALIGAGHVAGGGAVDAAALQALAETNARQAEEIKGLRQRIDSLLAENGRLSEERRTRAGAAYQECLDACLRLLDEVGRTDSMDLLLQASLSGKLKPQAAGGGGQG